jgi:threonine aldolase
VAASGIAASEWAATADSVSICLSKGLGAPVGSVICGDADFIERGMVVRKRLGGWMRQAGMIAAAGKMALEENVERLTEDHDLARSLATKLNAFDILHCPPDEVETNLVMVGVNSPRFDADDLAQELAAHGVRVLPLGREILRFVTHMDVGPEDVEKLDAALLDILG